MTDFLGWWLCLFWLSRMLCSLGRVLHRAEHRFGGAFSLHTHTQLVRFVKHPSFLYSYPLNHKLYVFLWFRTISIGALLIHWPSGNSEIAFFYIGWKELFSFVDEFEQWNSYYKWNLHVFYYLKFMQMRKVQKQINHTPVCFCLEWFFLSKLIL